MDPNACPKHDMSFFEDECPRCERDRLRAELKRRDEHEECLAAQHRRNLERD